MEALKTLRILHFTQAQTSKWKKPIVNRHVELKNDNQNWIATERIIRSVEQSAGSIFALIYKFTYKSFSCTFLKWLYTMEKERTNQIWLCIRTVSCIQKKSSFSRIYSVNILSQNSHKKDEFLLLSPISPLSLHRTHQIKQKKFHSH